MANQKIKGRLIILIFFVFLFCVSIYSLLFIFNDRMLEIWLKEDGVVEWLGTIAYLFASVLTISLFINSRPGNNFFIFRTKRNVFFLLLGLFFFFCFGEEISWGQRIFNFETPEKIKEMNYQDEMNIHNLQIFNYLAEDGEDKEGMLAWITTRLFSLFWFIYCFLIPLMNAIVKRISVLFKNLNLPIVPLWIGSMFMINHILAKILEKTNIFSSNQGITEIKESVFGVLFFLGSVSLFSIFKSKTDLSIGMFQKKKPAKIMGRE